ncbi:alpha/beta hydrolase [Pseudomonas sp. RIT-PI-S]|uniref:alpha/beta fold hydrolase n=1 Tax=Pseudomonas sp. RIT-PI-S TaxID=3035295 RepID=UPI0021D8A01E|nr:alpha/beta hydrolase [Pseudomonas sp. RIT-PI-S]
MKRIIAGVLDIAYVEVGPANGAPVVLLHGFPYDAHAYHGVAQRLAAAGRRCLVPWLRGYGPTRFLHAETPRSGEQAALGADLLAFLDALGIPQAVLGGYDWGGRAACVVAALWPQRVSGLVSCGAGYNIQNIAEAGKPASPESEHRYWYQYYLHGERGRAGLAANREAFCRLLWQMWSPEWAFDAHTFAQTAHSFGNPDFVEVVVHSYRHRFGLVPGDPAYQHIEAQLAAQPTIEVPTVVLEGGSDGVAPPSAEDKSAAHFTGAYQRQVVPGVGHNFPQEAPEVFTQAILGLPT